MTMGHGRTGLGLLCEQGMLALRRRRIASRWRLGMGMCIDVTTAAYGR